MAEVNTIRTAITDQNPLDMFLEFIFLCYFESTHCFKKLV